MGIKENKELVRQAYKLSNEGNWIAYYKLCSSEMVEHVPDGDMTVAKSKQFVANWGKNAVNLNATIIDMVAEGNMVAVRVTWSWKQKDTGKKIEMTNGNFIRIARGKIAEVWNVTDIRLAKQLGAVPF